MDPEPPKKKRRQEGRVVNVHAADLRRSGFRNLEHWLQNENHVYVGRNMTRYVPGAVGSKWHNPFTKKYGDLQTRIDLFEKHLLSSPELMSSLSELRGKKLGCWCFPDPCHASVLVRYVDEDERREKKEKEEGPFSLKEESSTQSDSSQPEKKEEEEVTTKKEEEDFKKEGNEKQEEKQEEKQGQGRGAGGKRGRGRRKGKLSHLK